MKRILLFLVLAGVLLILAAILVACGGQQTTPIATPATLATEVHTGDQVTEVPATAQVSDVPTAGPELFGDSIRGGKLYDNWIEELGVEAPADMNVLWAASKAGETSIEKSWSCVECHGWDFNGNSDFPGILADAGKDPYGILLTLKKDSHDFSTVLDDQALTDLALFVNQGVIATSAITSLTVNTDNGKSLFDDTCTDCHGSQALAISFHPDNEPEYPASIANEDPLELLGKLRYGVPGMPDMPSGIDNGWIEQNYADVIAYIKTLPMASPVIEGGRMYDNWFAAFEVSAPEGDMPLWKTQSTNTRSGDTTWRCKECHGWDYLGVDGAYATGSHMTGFPGIFSDSTMSAEEL